MATKKKSKGILEKIGDAVSSGAEAVADAGSKAIHAVGDLLPTTKPAPKRTRTKVAAKKAAVPKAEAKTTKVATKAKAPKATAAKSAAPKAEAKTAKPKVAATKSKAEPAKVAKAVKPAAAPKKKAAKKA